MKLGSILRVCHIILMQAFAQVRAVTELRDDWKFSRIKNDAAFDKDFNDKDWQTVTVPHDWAIYGPFDKEIDKQVVQITQNNEKVASEKNWSNWCTSIHWRGLVSKRI